MKILKQYLLREILKNFGLSLGLFIALFLIIDFLDRIDTIVAAGGSFGAALQYFLFKIPLTISLMTPIAILVSTLLTHGLLSKNAELTAMRAAGIPLRILCKPLITASLFICGGIFLLNELIVPLCTRRVKEIYNIDIQKKDQSGAYSQSSIWLRKGNAFLFVGGFDSRVNKMLGVTKFNVDEDFEVEKRIDAVEGHWIDTMLGWSLKDVTERAFKKGAVIDEQTVPALPLPITDEPQSFYDIKTDPATMSFRELRRYIKNQRQNGVSVIRYFTDLQEKLAFPFISLFVPLVALPFALQPARSGSLALSFAAGLAIGFSYYVVHSFGISLGHAELLPPVLAAWTANIVMLVVGVVLNIGAEAPR